MKVQVTAGELAAMAIPLQDLMAAKMPAGVGYHVARLGKALHDEIGIVLSKQRAIMQKYHSEETEEGDLRMTPANPEFAKAEAELNDLLVQTVILEVDMVILSKKIVLEPLTLLLLNKFLKVK